MILWHSLQNEHTLQWFWHTAIEVTVRCVHFETLTSHCANVSHMWLPYWMRSRVTHSVCIVFHNVCFLKNLFYKLSYFHFIVHKKWKTQGWILHDIDCHIDLWKLQENVAEVFFNKKRKIFGHYWKEHLVFLKNKRRYGIVIFRSFLNDGPILIWFNERFHVKGNVLVLKRLNGFGMNHTGTVIG